jgi:hypothetical protein
MVNPNNTPLGQALNRPARVDAVVSVDKFVVTLIGGRVPELFADFAHTAERVVSELTAELAPKVTPAEIVADLAADLAAGYAGSINMGNGIVITPGYRSEAGRLVTESKFYRLATTVYYDGEDVATLQLFNRAGEDYSELRIRNHVLYRAGWTGYVSRFLEATGAKVNGYTGVDIAIDGHGFIDTLHRAMIDPTISNYGRGKTTAHLDPTFKVLTGIDIGVKNGDKRVTFYNKTEELTKRPKPYIVQHWQRNGLDFNRQVDRSEVKLRNGWWKRQGAMVTAEHRQQIRAALEDLPEAGEVKTSFKEYSRNLIERRAAEIAAVKDRAANEVAIVGYWSTEASCIRDDREAQITSIRIRYKAERETMKAAKAEVASSARQTVDEISDGLTDLLNGNFDFRQLEDAAVLADIHKRACNSLVKLRQGTGRVDRLPSIPIIDYQALGAVDIKLASTTKKPSPTWSVKRKITFDVQATYAGVDLRRNDKLYSDVINESRVLAEHFGVLEWFYHSVPKWKRDKEYHDAVRDAVATAPARNKVLRLVGW